jgi:hypothetical protein
MSQLVLVLVDHRGSQGIGCAGPDLQRTVGSERKRGEMTSLLWRQVVSMEPLGRMPFTAPESCPCGAKSCTLYLSQQQPVSVRRNSLRKEEKEEATGRLSARPRAPSPVILERRKREGRRIRSTQQQEEKGRRGQYRSEGGHRQRRTIGQQACLP